MSLLQLSGRDLIEAASVIYREARKGRRIFAVVSGGDGADSALAEVCDRIGLTVAVHGAGGVPFTYAPVVIVRGEDRPAPDGFRIEAGPPLRVALAGCGVVGGGLLPRLLAHQDIDVAGVLVRERRKPRDVGIPEHLAVDDPAALLALEPDILIEVVSDASAGLALIRAALARGVDVVSANKQAVGADLPSLKALARSSGARLAFSAAVGGGSFMIETVRRAREHAPIVRIEAVLNGTVNFMLNQLGAGASFDAALQAAREAGFAEADPSADLEGRDAAAKLAILAEEAAGSRLNIESVRRSPLDGSTAEQLSSGAFRQVASCGLTSAGADNAQVRFVRSGEDPLFGDLRGEWNALRLTCADGRVFTCRGKGAGRWPTAESVWADLGDLMASRQDVLVKPQAVTSHRATCARDEEPRRRPAVERNQIVG